MGVEVAETADPEPIRELQRAWSSEDAGAPVDDPGYEAAFAEWWVAEAGRRRYWLASVGGRAVGMASVVSITRMPRPGRPLSRWGYVHQVYVLAPHRGAGVGTALVDAVAAACRADGYAQLVLNPRPRSRAFYRRCGFVAADHLLHREL